MQGFLGWGFWGSWYAVVLCLRLSVEMYATAMGVLALPIWQTQPSGCCSVHRLYPSLKLSPAFSKAYPYLAPNWQRGTSDQDPNVARSHKLHFLEL